MSWTDICSNCGEHRADCNCGNWNNTNDKVFSKTEKECDGDLYRVEEHLFMGSSSKVMGDRLSKEEADALVSKLDEVNDDIYTMYSSHKIINN